ncbi:MAG: hypothetical protein ACFFCW_00330 [Candidatus Hodarchaeota archaeon]
MYGIRRVCKGTHGEKENIGETEGWQKDYSSPPDCKTDNATQERVGIEGDMDTDLIYHKLQILKQLVLFMEGLTQYRINNAREIINIKEFNERLECCKFNEGE